MEQQQWPTKFQQSGASEVDEKDTIMNSSNSSENLLQLADNKVGNNEETCDQGVRLQQKCENEIRLTTLIIISNWVFTTPI